MKLVWMVGSIAIVLFGCNGGSSGVDTDDDVVALASGTFVGSSSLVMFDTCGLGVTADDLNTMSVEVIVADRAIILEAVDILHRAIARGLASVGRRAIDPEFQLLDRVLPETDASHILEPPLEIGVSLSL